MTDDHCDQINHGMKSMQLDDEDTSKYFINYISNDSDALDSNPSDTEHVHSRGDASDLDLSTLPASLIITSVPQELFTNQQMKDEFEDLFRMYDPDIVVLYLKFFQRVRITFTTSYTALQARLNLHQYNFYGQSIKTYFASPIIFRGSNPETYLRLPEPDKLFLISPPASPPVGWEQKLEDPPIVDFNLLAAIAQLQPNQAHELVPRESGSNAPAIIIHTCDDGPESHDSNAISRARLIKPTLVQTRRPPHEQE